MNNEIVESVQHSITPGEPASLYYPGEVNTKVQCAPTTVENRFYVDLPSKSSGSTSTIIFNPDEGVSDIVLTATLPAPVGSLYTNWALPRNWLGAMISQIGLRIAGSSLYYFTGDQITVDTLTDCEDAEKKNAVFELGGAELTQLADYNSVENRTGYVYIKLPFNSISSLQKTLPCPTDLLTQPVQLLIQFKPFSDVFFDYSAGGNAALTDIPTAFDSAAVNFKQTHLTDTRHRLTSDHDMNKEALTYPLRYFSQTSFRTNVVGAATGLAQINLTGFRAGSLKYIDLYAVKQSDLVAGNPWNYIPMSNIRLSVNGLVYYDSRVNSSQIWSICDRKTTASVDSTVLTAAGGVCTAVPSKAFWTVIPFGQVAEPEAHENDLVLGLSIMNSVVNLQLNLPTDDTYVVTANYHYASSLMFSRGSAEYVF